MARILAVGIATVDIILQVTDFPAEDSEVRALGQRTVRGGNATNTLTVLSQLGHDCSWAGVLAEDANAARIRADLGAYDIDLRECDACVRGEEFSSALETGCRLAGRKCGQQGFAELGTMRGHD